MGLSQAHDRGRWVEERAGGNRTPARPVFHGCSTIELARRPDAGLEVEPHGSTCLSTLLQVGRRAILQNVRLRLAKLPRTRRITACPASSTRRSRWRRRASPTTSSAAMKTSERVRRTTLHLALDELADLNGVDEMHVELHGRLRLPLVGVPAGHAHRAVGEGHQHAALHDAAAVVVLGLGHEGVEKAVAGRARPERADQADEALVAVGLPAGGGGIEGGAGRRAAWQASDIGELASVDARRAAGDLASRRSGFQQA